ncbi:ABC transporter I family member 20 [Striga hermonthica]|uniref:ABC transporter I family member 20 n=1 Tax=Striga hermonthica TaxID=68872 RepID=A0A9N7NJM7_STRHE|nr:ABC transporter I family member 20 [Striga hermonthica]
MAGHDNPQPTLEIKKLRFTYPGIDGHPPPGSTPLIDDLSLTLFPGDRCLLVGSNGAGKTTILKIIGGKHMVEQDMMDVSAEKMIFGVAGINPQRRDELIKVLGIDLSWRMHKVSDGQRRRVQICMGLLKPFKVLLLDKITVNLDVLARADLL